MHGNVGDKKTKFVLICIDSHQMCLRTQCHIGITGSIIPMEHVHALDSHSLKVQDRVGTRKKELQLLEGAFACWYHGPLTILMTLP